MEILYLIIIAVLILILFLQKTGKKARHHKTSKQSPKEDIIQTEPEKVDAQYCKTAYSPKWMFTMNEKAAYYKIESIIKKHNLRLFAKVRLFDLITPQRNHPKYKSNMYRIQAKHVDFVITTDNLVAKYIIELDDNSHNSENRKNRDEFVDTVLKACGYKILHIRDVNETEIEHFINAQ